LRSDKKIIGMHKIIYFKSCFTMDPFCEKKTIRGFTMDPFCEKKTSRDFLNEEWIPFVRKKNNSWLFNRRMDLFREKKQFVAF